MRKNSLTGLIAVIVVGLMVVIGVGIFAKSLKSIKNNLPFINMFNYKTETKLDVRAITARAMEMSDLVAAETDVPGTIEYTRYEEKLGPDAYVRYMLNYIQNIEARIDLSKISIEQSGSRVTVKMPNPTIQYNEPKITNFILIDESFFRSVSMREGEILLDAKEKIVDDVTKKVNLNVMKDIAKQKAKNVIGNLIREFDRNNNYSIEFEFFYDNVTDLYQMIGIN